MSSPDLAITVRGLPAPGGSKRAFIPKRKDGSYVTRPGGAPAVNIVDDSKRNKEWRGKVMEAVADEIGPPGTREGYPLDGPVELAVVFTVPKPQTLPRERLGRAVTKPDVLKLLRSTEDALKDAGLVTDDARIWRYRELAKVYPGTHPMALPLPGAVIYLWRTRPLSTVTGQVITLTTEGTLF